MSHPKCKTLLRAKSKIHREIFFDHTAYRKLIISLKRIDIKIQNYMISNDSRAISSQPSA